MTNCDSGCFAAKHAPDTTVALNIVKAVQERLVDQEITCQSAYAISQALGVTPREVGVAIDLAEGRIRKCQLGLFGYDEPKRKVIEAVEVVAPEIREAIERQLIDGHLTCSAAWHIADDAGIARLTVANTCEALKIKIIHCQLGAF